MQNKITYGKSASLVFFTFFFSIRFFFHGHWRLTGQQEKEGDNFLFHSITSTGSRTFRHLFSTLHVRWLWHIFYRTACIYQNATPWDLPQIRIAIWLIDDVKLVFFCLLDDLILGFCYSNLDTGNRWTRARIDCHPCINKWTDWPRVLITSNLHLLSIMKYFKVGLPPSMNADFICFSESPLKMMKNAFYFTIKKTLFIFNIFEFLS